MDCGVLWIKSSRTSKHGITGVMGVIKDGKNVVFGSSWSIHVSGLYDRIQNLAVIIISGFEILGPIPKLLITAGH